MGIFNSNYNSDFISDHVIYIIPLHKLALFIKITFSVDLCVRLFEHTAALLCERESIVFKFLNG